MFSRHGEPTYYVKVMENLKVSIYADGFKGGDLQRKFRDIALYQGDPVTIFNKNDNPEFLVQYDETGIRVTNLKSETLDYSVDSSVAPQEIKATSVSAAMVTSPDGTVTPRRTMVRYNEAAVT